MTQFFTNLVQSFLPAAGTAARSISYGTLQNFVLNSITAPVQADLSLEARHNATYDQLCLKKKPLTPQDTTLYENFALKLFTKTPEAVRFEQSIQAMLDLAHKIVAAGTFYFTFDLSIYQALTNLLPQKIADVALPILYKASSHPAAAALTAARVIVFAPVITQLLYMALVHGDPEGKNRWSEAAKPYLRKLSQTLEFIWQLRAAVISLGFSTTFYSSIVSVIYTSLVNRFAPSFHTKLALLNLQSLVHYQMSLNPTTDAPPSSLTAMLTLFAGFDYFPTIALTSSLSRMKDLLPSTATPYDIKTLETLFHSSSQCIKQVELKQLKEAVDSVNTTRSAINEALDSGKINEQSHAALHEIVDTNLADFLVQVCNQFSISELDEEDRNALADLFCQGPNKAADSEKFLDLLEEFQGLATATISWDLNRRIAEVSKNAPLAPLGKVLWNKIKDACQKIVDEKSTISPNGLALYAQHLTSLESLGCPKAEINTERSRVFAIIAKKTELGNLNALRKTERTLTPIQQLQLKNICPTLILHNTNNTSDEASKFALFNRHDGLIHRFAVTQKEKDQAFVLSAKFHFLRFERNFGGYLALKNPTPEQLKAYEYFLIHLLDQAKIDPKRVEQTEDFKTWKQVNESKTVSDYLVSSKEFAFAREQLKHPPAYQTKFLPERIAEYLNGFREAKYQNGLTNLYPKEDPEQPLATESEIEKWLRKTCGIEDVENGYISSTKIEEVVNSKTK